MRHQLVGYVLGALDDAEHQHVESHLSNDSQLRDDVQLLRRCVKPLGDDAGHIAPPPGLAQRTCQFVAQRATTKQPLRDDAVSDGAVAPPRHRWSIADMAVAAGIVLTAGMLVLPALHHSRFSARILACQNKLTQIGSALHRYSESHNGQIPSIPQSGPLSIAGVYAPKLLEAELIDDAQVFICGDTTAATDATPPAIPTYGRLVELQESGSDQLDQILAGAGGSYGYNLGYMRDGTYHTTVIRDVVRPTYVLMADAPCPARGFAQSSNHGGDGQNVLFEDLHVGYLKDCCVPSCADKDFFRNDDGELAAGTHADDAVVGHCSARPCPQEPAASAD